MLLPIKIGGVPEHFNFPWYHALESRQFEKAGIPVEWNNYPGGTGAMMQDIREKKLDVAIALTEGVISEIVNQQSCKILQLFVQSPLIWGIHVAADSTFQRVDELEGKRFAISRKGSGSHLMAYVHALQQKWNPDLLTLIPVGNLEGAREALANHEADGFMWEKFMTKPLVDSGEFRRIGVCPTPWPCFAMVGSTDFLSNQAEVIPAFLRIINQSCKEFMTDVMAPQQVSVRYNLRLEDAKLWFSQTKWATDNRVSPSMLLKVLNTLSHLGTASKTVSPTPADLCSGFCQLTKD